MTVNEVSDIRCRNDGQKISRPQITSAREMTAMHSVKKFSNNTGRVGSSSPTEVLEAQLT